MKLLPQEASVLLYLETCAVDRAGSVDGRHMNEEDFEIARRWDRDEFLEFGRVLSDHVRRDRTHWVRLGKKAMRAAHAERSARAERMWDHRPYKTTEER